MIFSEVDSVSL